MGMTVKKSADTISTTVFLSNKGKVADSPMGVSVSGAELVNGSVLLDGSVVAVPAAGIAKVQKSVKTLAGSTTTSIICYTEGNQFKEGDIVGSKVGGIAQAITVIVSDSATKKDTMTIGVAIDDPLANGDFIYHMSAVTGSTDATFNIAYDNDTCAGLTGDTTSDDIKDGPIDQETEATIVGSIDGAQQVETATIVGLIEAAGAGNATITITSADVGGSPLAISVALANDDTAQEVAGKVRNELRATAAVTTSFDIAGEDEYVVLIRNTKAANDATLNIASIDDTCTGLTAQANSADTLEGSVSGAGDAELIITGSDLAGSPLTVLVAVLDGDTTEEVAEKMRSELDDITAITDVYIVGGIGEKVSLTKKDEATVSALKYTPYGITGTNRLVDTTTNLNVDVWVIAAVKEGTIGQELLDALLSNNKLIAEV